MASSRHRKAIRPNDRGHDMSRGFSRHGGYGRYHGFDFHGSEQGMGRRDQHFYAGHDSSRVSLFQQRGISQRGRLYTGKSVMLSPFSVGVVLLGW